MTDKKTAEAQLSPEQQAEKNMFSLAKLAGEKIGLSGGHMLDVLIDRLGMGNASAGDRVGVLAVIREYGLNPLTKEIHAFKGKGGWNIIVGVDGWIRIANEHPDYDGFDSGHVFDEKGNLLSCWVEIYHKRRLKPIKAQEYLEECIRDTEPWRTMPKRMLWNKAFAQAVRRAFSVGGIYHDIEPGEEIRDAKATVREPVRTAAVEVSARPLSEAERAEMIARRGQKREPTPEPERAPEEPDSPSADPAHPATPTHPPESSPAPADDATHVPHQAEADEPHRPTIPDDEAHPIAPGDVRPGGLSVEIRPPTDMAEPSEASGTSAPDASEEARPGPEPEPEPLEFTEQSLREALRAFIAPAVNEIRTTDGAWQAVLRELIAVRGNQGTKRSKLDDGKPAIEWTWDLRSSSLSLDVSQGKCAVPLRGKAVQTALMDAVASLSKKDLF